MTPHTILRLCGNAVEPIGCGCPAAGIVFAPSNGLLRRCGKLLLVAQSEVTPGTPVSVRLVQTPGSNGPVTIPVVAPVDGPAERELVLVQEYKPGCGAKRWPAFQAVFGPETRTLRQDETSGGSGWERWTLISAPLGWASNIAQQFRNERDVESQTISYQPGVPPPLADPGKPAPPINGGAWAALDSLGR